MSNEYDIGYGRPPKGSRFKPGQSGNPKGRPKRARESLDRAEIFWRVGFEMITLQTDAGPLELNRFEALVQRLKGMELKGDRCASGLLHQLRMVFPEPQSEASSAIVWIVGDDAKL
jgi:Family of unknown function (DUF5681)